MSSNSKVTPANSVTCYTFKELYDRVRSRPFNQPFALRYSDGRVDQGLNSEEAMKDSLRAHDNPYLKQPVIVEW
ncbi:MAG: hypothetical protein LC639_07465 [Idiomarina sp.]|nr:hypothetical protein [Idiomarina sp.]